MPSSYKLVDVTAQATYPAAPQIDLEYMPDGHTFTLLNAAGDAVVLISFDGTNDHMILRSGTAPTKGRGTRAKKVWLKKSAGTGSVTIDVESGDGA